MSQDPMPSLELWGGIECTVNRVGDAYFDQLEKSGHLVRTWDLALAARAGFRKLRYPVLWERSCPEGGAPDFSWVEGLLGSLRDHGMEPIVGLVHHGSGPRGTSLVDPLFAEKLAAYARAVAARFPWVSRFTPVNEPVTTARFSGLYGFWHPHGKDDRTFVRVLLGECRATVLAMRAIREMTPGAELVLTDDVGVTYATEALSSVAEHANERRYLAFDLLSGKVGREHPLFGYLTQFGASEAELTWFRANTCPPAIVGLNYYVTSDRWLDERCELYPNEYRAAHAGGRYVDIEAVRVRRAGITGFRRILEDAWRRYGLPVALTEVHLACTREEQLRWAREAWQAAVAARVAGVDVRAVTLWSLFGAFDWDSLVTCDRGSYESGVFDLRAPAPRSTALFVAARSFAALGGFEHPVASSPGWWRREARILFGEAARSEGGDRPAVAVRPSGPPLLIAGAGRLAGALATACDGRAITTKVMGRREMDLADPASIARALDEHRPWAIVNTAGFGDVDRAESEWAACFRDNTALPVALARACRERGLPLVTLSTDLVFDGRETRPYVESATPAPLSVFGLSKAEAEARVLELLPSALVVRTSAPFGPAWRCPWTAAVLGALRAGESFAAADDLTFSPTYAPHLAHAVLDLLLDGERGVWHLVHRGEVTWRDLARLVADAAGFDRSSIVGRSSRALGARARRPSYSVLESCRGHIMPPLERALEAFAQEARNGPSAALSA